MSKAVTLLDTSIKLNESSYGATHSAIIVLYSKSRYQLEQHIADNRFVRLHEGDRPGEQYATSLQCLRYVKGDSDLWQAICISSSHWDV